MKAAVVRGAGQAPAYADFAEPEAQAGEALVSVSAAAVSPLARARAMGAHYSSEGAYPLVAGVDGVGRLDSGERVYFLMPRAPFGALAARAPVRRTQCVSVPDGLDDATAAALANPGMSSWAALTERARLQPGETVIVNGAAGAAGRLAIQIAKRLGAGRVVATARNAEALDSLAALGADETIALVEDGKALEARFREVFAQGVGVVLDYVWGASAERLLAAAGAAKLTAPLRVVQIGSPAGPTIALSGALLRSTPVEIMGSGLGSVSNEGLLRSIQAVFAAAPSAGFAVATRTAPLAEVERAWGEKDDGRRLVVTV